MKKAIIIFLLLCSCANAQEIIPSFAPDKVALLNDELRKLRNAIIEISLDTSNFCQTDGTNCPASGGGLTITGTDNYIVRMDGTNAIQDSLVSINDAGFVGIGVADALYPEQISGEVDTSTGSGNLALGIYSYNDQLGTDSVAGGGFTGNKTGDGDTGLESAVLGSVSSSVYQGNGVQQYMIGSQAQVSNFGDEITNAIAFYAFSPNQFGNDIQKAVGLQIEAQKVSSAVIAGYGIFQNGDTTKNFFSGSVIEKYSYHYIASDFTMTTNTDLENVVGVGSDVLCGVLVSGRRYAFEAKLFVDADNVGGHKYAIGGGTATATSIVYNINSISNDTSQYVITSRETAINGDASSSGGTSFYTEINGTILVNSGGNMCVRFAENVSSGTSKVLKNSTFVIKEFNNFGGSPG